MFAARADAPASDWPSYNRLLSSDRYAPFKQINTTNVARLKQLCVYDLAVEVSFQSGPILIGRVLYVTTEKDTVAIDADTCQQKWRAHEEGPSSGLRVNRGAAYLDGRIFRGTEDGDVLAYDAASGKSCGTPTLPILARRRASLPRRSRGMGSYSSAPPVATTTA